MNTRREFIKSAAAMAALGPGLSFAAQRPVVRKGKTLLVVFLRGGIDGLNFIVPHGDPHYYQHRGRIAIARPGRDDGAVDLDGFFGLHPSAKSLAPFFKQGTCRAVQAVGYAKNTRSHFQEQDTWETGVMGGASSSEGWLNRHLASSEGRGTVRAVSIGGNLPRILRGKAAAYSIRSVGDLVMPDLPGDRELLREALRSAYCETPNREVEKARELMSRTAAATLDGTRQLEAIANQPYQPRHGAEYPEKGVGRQLREAARLIRADIGTEVIEIDYGGWDTHNNQGGASGGYANRLAELTQGLAAFARDLGDRMDDVMVMTLSDFGRTVRENGTQGTDHGWANCLLVMGGEGAAAKRQPVGGRWPGLAPENLHQNRDLQHTTDFRDLIGDALASHLGNPAADFLLPGHTYRPTGLLA
jgi:uncharacterized protein (DUF1501 family)